MIEISSLTEKDKEREVLYEDYGQFEWGRITSWNEKYVFVRYHARQWKNMPHGEKAPLTGTTSQATRPEDLEFCS